MIAFMGTYIKKGRTGYGIKDTGFGLLLFYPFAFPGALPEGIPDPLGDREPRRPRMLFFSLGDTNRLSIRRLQSAGDDLARRRRKTLYLRDDSVFKTDHATFELKNEKWWIQDSRTAQRKAARQNAVVVNGQELSGSRQLNGGEVIAVGCALLRFLSPQMSGSSASDTIWATYEEPIVGGPKWQDTVEKMEVLIGWNWRTITNILITGETGTGKERAARYFRREGAPFVAVNCAAIPENLLEAQLFGHTRGAFTGAVADARGMFVEADGGTLFLDEIAEMSLTSQAKLLRVLQDNEVTAVGSNKTVRVDVCTVAATNQDLEQQVREGNFREDLYHRVKSITLVLPSMSQGPEDIPLLIRHVLMQESAPGTGGSLTLSPYLPISSGAMEWLCTRRWSGNVRQLQGVLKSALLEAGALGAAGKIELAHLEAPAQAGVSDETHKAPAAAHPTQPASGQISYLAPIGKSDPAEYLRQYFHAGDYKKLRNNRVTAFRDDGRDGGTGRRQVDRGGRDPLLKLVLSEGTPEEVARSLLKEYRAAGEGTLRKLAAHLQDIDLATDILAADRRDPPDLDPETLCAVGQALDRALDEK